MSNVKTEHHFQELLSRPRATQVYDAIVDHVIDGDTLVVDVPAWAGTPFVKVSLRVYGIDTPECTKAHAKCAKELKLGLAAQSYAKTLAKKGDQITFEYEGHDKYFRVDAKVTLKAGDWGVIMMSNGFAAPYFGGTKRSWCK